MMMLRSKKQHTKGGLNPPIPVSIHWQKIESQLKAKCDDANTPFQCKLWVEMYAKGGHNSLDDPPHAAV